jgi:uncharacterized membrane protein YhaH (DUF805 family)
MDKFLGFRGRIGRGRWWLGIFTLLMVSLMLYFALAFLFGISLWALIGMSAASPETVTELYIAALVMGGVVTVALIYPSLSLSAQRLNDRNRPTWLVWLTLVPTLLTAAASYLGIATTWTEVSGVRVPQPTAIGWAVNLLSFLIALWILVDLGILRGTKGPNQHGPDPLER